MSGLISSSARYTRDGADKTVRYAVGTPQNVNSAAGTFDILLKDGSGAMSFAMNDDVKLAINGVEDMAGLDGANTVTVREVSESGWTTRLRRGLGLFADSGLVAAEARYESADGVKTVQQWVGTPQNIADGKFELALRDGSATLSFNTDDEIDTLIAGLNADSLVAVAQTTSADGATTLRVLAEDNRSHGRFGMFGKFGDHDGKSHGGNRGMPNF